jgi:ADP-ribose pyrophosphatase
MPRADKPCPDILLETSRFKVLRHHYLAADGRPITRETVQHPGAVVIIPLMADGSVCLLRNYRVAVHQMLIELPAGTLESGEKPKDAAARELAEETGYAAGRLDPLAELLMSPGILNERMYVFVATELSSGKPAPEAGEEIEAFVVPWQEALAMTEDGRIQDAKTIAALLLFDRKRRG